jgi:hypothetical protein
MFILTLALMMAVSLGAGVAASAAPTEAPVAIVQGLYAHEAQPVRVEPLFASDLARAYRQAGAIGFDWRYGARAVKITGLNVYTLPSPPVGAGQAPETIVAVDFHNLGQPRRVFYRFCRTARQQWRIADVQSRDAPVAWSLRQMLRLDLERVRC